MSNRKQSGHYHHGDLVNVLLETAGALLESKGPAGLSLREVARSAGVSHAAPYRHFRDRAALLQALAQRGFERLQRVLDRTADAARQNPEQQLVDACVACVRQAERYPELSRLMFGGLMQQAENEAGRDAARAAFGSLEKILQDGVAGGVFRQRDTQELALTVWAAMHGLAMLATAGQLAALQGNDVLALDSTVRVMATNVLYGIAP